MLTIKFQRRRGAASKLRGRLDDAFTSEGGGNRRMRSRSSGSEDESNARGLDRIASRPVVYRESLTARTNRDSARGTRGLDSKRACTARGSYRLRHVGGHALVPTLSRSAPRNIIACSRTTNTAAAPCPAVKLAILLSVPTGNKLPRLYRIYVLQAGGAVHGRWQTTGCTT